MLTNPPLTGPQLCQAGDVLWCQGIRKHMKFEAHRRMRASFSMALKLFLASRSRAPSAAS